jgi:hypothetical protein
VIDHFNMFPITQKERKNGYFYQNQRLYQGLLL